MQLSNGRFYKISPEVFGTAANITIDNKKTTIVDGAGSVEAIEERIHQYFLTLARNSLSFWFGQYFTPELKSIGSTKGIYNYFFKEIPIFSSPQTVFFYLIFVFVYFASPLFLNGSCLNEKAVCHKIKYLSNLSLYLLVLF